MTGIDALSGQENEMEELEFLANAEARYLTYIRPVTLGDGIGYAVCSEDGAQLAVFTSQEAAFFSARQHNLLPMRVH